MKRKVINIIIMLIVLITLVEVKTNKVFAQNGETIENKISIVKGKKQEPDNLNEQNNSSNKENTAYTLDELLNDKEEQTRIQKYREEILKKEEENNNKSQKAVLATNGKIEYESPVDGSASFVRGASYNGNEYFIDTSTRYITSKDETESYFEIYKHNIRNNENTMIYDARSENARVVTTNVNNNTLYVLYVTDYKFQEEKNTVHDTCYILGIDLKTDEIVLKQKYNFNLIIKFYTSFTVDSQQRVYFVYNSDGIKVFDKTGKEIYNKEPSGSNNGLFIYLKSVSPNDKILFFQVMFLTNPENTKAFSEYEGMQKLDNGKFVVQDQFTVYNNQENPIWHFLDNEGNYAINQYGQMARFYYDVDSVIQCDREILVDVQSTVLDIVYTPYYPNVCQNGDIIYVLGSNNNIYLINKKTLQYNQYIKTDLEQYEDLYNLSYIDNNLILLRFDVYCKTRYYIEQINLNDCEINTTKDIVLTNDSTTKHTVDDIITKYKETLPKYDYNKSIYKTTPSWKSPYKAGSLQDGVVTDTINRLNYYRWLVGVDEIGVNNSKLDRNQKGAVISKANETMSHTPTKPSDMDEEFYKEAYDGCSAKYEEGDTYSGNVSKGDMTLYQAIDGFVSEINNIGLFSATGHRQSMLDPKATATSFGQCEEYSTVSVYYDDTKDVTSSQFYAFPSAGYFPNTQFKLSEYWSVYFTGTAVGEVKVDFIYKGKRYQADDLSTESGYPVLNFKIPLELRKEINNDIYDYEIPAGTELQVEIYNVQDENLNNVTYKYTVNFFDMKSEVPSAQDVADLIFDYKFYADSYPDIKAVYGYNETALKNHWLTTGISEGRQGSAVFSPKYYVYNNKDIMNAFGLDYKTAYNHFITTGYAELRASSNEYYGKYYKNYTDLKDFSSYKLMKHYMEYGRQEGRKATNILDLTPIDIKPYLLDYDLYTTLEDNKDLKRAFGNDQGALKNHWETDGKREGRIASVVFDAKYYLNKYADLKKSYGEDYVKAYEHFITVGIYEGRQGSMYFNPKWYVENNTDIKETYGENYSKALEQFVNYGLKEGRRASAEFNVKQYRENYADLREAYGTNYKEYYKHYISYGKAEGRNGTTKEVRKLSELEEYLYNEEVYLSANGDIRELYKKDPTKTKNHWIEYGIRDGRKASLVFDAKWYLENNKDLKEAYGNDYTKAYNHFIEYGIKEGRQGSIYFNAKWYLENNADLKEVYGKDYTKALKHFVEYGAKEGRAGSKEFNCKKYKANYADLREAYGNDNIQYFLHYMNCGIKEGRKPI